MSASDDVVPAGPWLRRYLRDHYTASAAGLALFRRAAGGHSDPRARAELARLAAANAEDRAALLGVLDELGVQRSPGQERLAVLGERLGRLKTNGTLLRRSPLSDVVELEALCLAVHSKRLGWLCLRAVAAQVRGLNPHQLDQLIERAEHQHSRLEELRLATAGRVMSDREGVG